MRGNRVWFFSVKYKFDTKRLCNSSTQYSGCSFSFYWSFLGFRCIFKETKPKKKIFRQSWTKLWTFSRFSTISRHHKWNRIRSLNVDERVTKPVAKWQKTYDLKKLENFKQIPEIFRFDGKYQQPATQNANFKICVRKSSKISSKTFHKETYFT